MTMVCRSDFGRAVVAALRDPSTTVAAAFGGVVFDMDQFAAPIPSVDESVHSKGQLQFKGRPPLNNALGPYVMVYDRSKQKKETSM
jgi:hypothetical protein